ncbi:MAG: Rid family detoxifying hydrolase [Deltaproteobacteria bacterium]|jgi:2-iminobutanoate/2-iminopropanoate deaminase|nr:Rid family detoxifying hydrolase [Deltaproteobacteria bacterium]
MKREIVFTPAAPPPGPYSQAIKYGQLVFVSGQTPEDPKTGAPVRGTMAEQTRVVLTNIKAILEAAGSSLEKVLKVNIYLSDITKKPEMNEVYREFFKTDPPARIAMAVAGLDDGLDIEIDVIAASD